MDLVWTYSLGPLLALLPERWRQVPLWYGRVRWERAGTISGILEIAAAITASGYWYMFEMSRRMAQIMDLADSGKLGPGVEEHQVTGAALTLFYMSPVTWSLFYFFMEGAVRFCAAAFTDKGYGSLPLWMVERVTRAISIPRERRVIETAKEYAWSITESIRERVMIARLKDGEDELTFLAEGPETMLEICASRRKQEWDPPQIVRVDEAFYRLEESRLRRGPRPFQYRLRKLEAGVMGRKVLQYRTR
jgi:hypothetical protein